MNILIKNMLDCLIGAMAYWSFGWGLAYGPGGNGFTGGSQFFSTGGMEASDYPSWFFQVGGSRVRLFMVAFYKVVKLGLTPDMEVQGIN